MLTVGIFDKSMVSTLSILGGGGKTLFFTFVEYGWELEKCLGVCFTGSTWGSGLELKKETKWQICNYIFIFILFFSFFVKTSGEQLKGINPYEVVFLLIT